MSKILIKAKIPITEKEYYKRKAKVYNMSREEARGHLWSLMHQTALCHDILTDTIRIIISKEDD